MDSDTDMDENDTTPLSNQLAKCDNVLTDRDEYQPNTIVPSLPSTSTCPTSFEDSRAIPGTSKNIFHLSTESIPCIPHTEQEQELLGLGVSVYDQTQFEIEVIGQVDKALKEQEEKKRIEDAKRELNAVNEDIKFARQRLKHIDKATSMAPKDPNLLTNVAKRELSAINKEKDNKLKHLKKLQAKQKALQACITGNQDEVSTALQSNMEGNEEMDEETLYHLTKVFAAKETEEERLIRTGEMTPFGTMNKPKPRQISIPENELTDFDQFLLDEVQNHVIKKSAKLTKQHALKPESTKPSPIISVVKSSSSFDFKGFTDLKAVPMTKQNIKKVKLGSKHAKGYVKKTNSNRSLVKNYKSDSEISDFEAEFNDEKEVNDDKGNYSSDDVYIPDKYSEEDDDFSLDKNKGKRGKNKKTVTPKKSRKCTANSSSDSESFESKTTKSKGKKVVDDGNQEAYVKRIRNFERAEFARKQLKMVESGDYAVDSDKEDVTELDEEYKIPNSVWIKLYEYQRTAVRWLWELHLQNCGGIVGDEMGLGKTIQMIAFFVGLRLSKQLTNGDSFRGLGPVMLVCPATVMHQWVKEFHTWWPPFRVAVLHESGSYVGKKDLLIRNINKSQGVLITSYAGIVQHQESLVAHEWHYIVLDEGHKIRNPDAQATLAAKQFRTPHRIILSGSPVQNNLKELWSLFDFIFPGKLGTLPVFMQQFSVPIVLGGYANASQVQVQTAYKCATVLRDTIKPFLLRRMKSDVKMSINLPDKSEQVLFCQLTEEQVHLYKGYINSKEVSSILDARLQIFVGLINLRKICNHPDIFDGGPKIFKDTDIGKLTEEEQYGFYKRSGKMIVVEALLRLWHVQGHRVLLFTQSRQMMAIFEIFVKSRGYTYMKMDGGTSISSRQPAIAKFNSDPNIFVFLLTTRVGGLGVNLTGANRVILYDPDWNPSTDAQARERAWRIGQQKQVTIYRLLTAGTIEEKIYHRQIFKQFVTNRVLKDPRQRRFFKSNDMFELFTYQEVGPGQTETSAIFAGTGSEVKLRKKSHREKPSPRDMATAPVKKDSEVCFSEEKREQMKQLAKKLSLDLLKKNMNSNSGESNKQVNGATGSSPITNEVSVLKEERPKAKKRKRKLKDDKQKKPHKRKAAKIDGEKIDFLVKTDVYKPPQDDEEKNLKQDDYVLSKLFKNSGVHTALKHDAIVEASDPDYMIVEGEATRVAKEAIIALKKSRIMCSRAEEGIPTWTGQNGGARPRFGQKKKTPIKDCVKPAIKPPKSPKHSKQLIFDGETVKPDNPSSSDFLSSIKNRLTVFGTDAPSDESDTDSPPLSTASLPGTENDELLVDIRNFVAFQGTVDGQATTKELLEAFREKLPVNQTAVFKAMLSKICDFSRSGGEGVWHLKGDFR